MGNLRLKGKDLRKLGYTNNKAKSIAINIVSKHLKHYTKNEAEQLLKDMLSKPEDFTSHEFLAELANEFIKKTDVNDIPAVEALDNPNDFLVFGKKHISENTIRQMEKAMSLPIAEKGALMPDAHEGYGLPIGGVYATRNEIVPYGVGLDIGCRMCLSIYKESDKFLHKHEYKAKQALLNHTHFGIKGDIKFSYDHEVMENPLFKTIPLAAKLQGKARKQLGTSGSGNHFVEIGLVELKENNTLSVESGTYVGILSHSGSRGFGAEIAKFYTQLAMKQLKMPKGLQHLAWLSLDSDAGHEYWQLMNLAGEYAKACHDLIHHSISRALGFSQILKIENHHNFAWREKLHDGNEYIVHRKGATPAGKNAFGIIPGSMTQPGYIIRGMGNELSLSSASHGAGRKITRNKARNSITMSEVRKHLKQNKVTLIGGGVDEAPFVYKDLEVVMQGQKDLVQIEGKFIPKIVRMDKS
ncbi:MAG: RtcB family protein [Bacteroidales bacterium]|nr:RtcB family protein [Bacteroidales bacterium]